ncbi:MAG: SIMPL domain-containing protein [Chloroflexi bacterium]|nr:SIMPL domain-containing protein [Chloroflexota bacterium]
MKKTFLFSLLIVLTLGLGACAPATSQTAPARTLNVSGSGQAILTPDIAAISIGVRTEGESAAAALSRNNARAQNVADTLTKFGVAEEDIQTRNFSIWPSQKRDSSGNVIGTTYVVDNTVYVTVRDLEKLGELLDAVVQSGANNINNIQFDVDDKTAALSAARIAAIESAHQQALELAEAAGVKLGEVQTISFYDSTPQTVDLRRADFAMAEAASVPVQPGQTSLTVTVNVVYEIK